ncbi:TrkH family potassium uptake protein [Arcanobacterium hippocoleae]|uniref:Trk-type K+ transport system membrane component n=1 Tax=Arcanobacterium hippocoleae TaxID=149017 RepID=A0ABU1T375_9ACTO|nr:potassium transporter TrkG [Arcanobacterium hippocoleae]MDR6939300.1 Trk-type K+ transport system membrane component [Arcanobacterium hippocoleae]
MPYSRLRLSTQFRDRLDSFAKRSPARFAMLVFAGIIVIFTLLLMLPIATHGAIAAPFLTALFTATSAVCVTGITVVETATYWSPFGKGVLVLAMQIGALGVMTLASLLGLAVSRHIGLTQRILTATETKSRLGDVGSLLRAVVITSLTVETALSLGFLAVFADDGRALIETVGHAIFMGVSTFNNGGFVSLPGGIAPYADSWSFGILVITGTIIGAVGFPVILNISQQRTRFAKWSLHSKLTVVTYLILLVSGALLFVLLEWQNESTLGTVPGAEKVLLALFHSTTARSSGLATLDPHNFTEASRFMMDILMFIGGGSAGTGGGIKVTTFAVLMIAILAEARGDRDTEAFEKRIPHDVLRLAISATFLGALLVGVATMLLLQITHLPLNSVLFEVISAFATCGLSTGITASLPASAQIVLIVLMYLGRVGTMTMAAALALRHRRRVIRFPEERPVIG